MFGVKKKQYKNILVLGLGGVGYYLTKRLALEGHAITAIESNPELIKHADGEIDAQLIKGDAMNFKNWKDAGTKKFDYFIAVTNNDAVNILCSIIADRLGIPSKIARVRSLGISEKDAILTAQDLKVDLVIHPEELAAQEIVRLIKLKAGNIIIDIAQGQMGMMTTRIRDDSPWADKSIKDISQQHNAVPFCIVSISRDSSTIIPDGDQVILPNDQIFLLANSQDLNQLMELTGDGQKTNHRVTILGGGLVGTRVAELLENSFSVTLIEKDEKRAEELSFTLGKTEVLHGDGSNANTLTMAGIENRDTFIAVTEDNETNIMANALAKNLVNKSEDNNRQKNIKTIALVDKEEYLVLAGTMGSDVTLNKKVLAGNEILKFIRRGKLLSMEHLYGFDAEVVEFVPDPNSPITRKPLFKQHDLKGKILIGGVYRDDSWHIPSGLTHIQAGERVIAVYASSHLNEVQKLFLS